MTFDQVKIGALFIYNGVVWAKDSPRTALHMPSLKSTKFKLDQIVETAKNPV
jgi:hypothetical protein